MELFFSVLSFLWKCYTFVAFQQTFPKFFKKYLPWIPIVNVPNFLKQIGPAFVAFIRSPAQSNLRIQLVFIYFFAFIDLCFTILSFVFQLDIPDVLGPFTDFFFNILDNAYLQFLFSPEKTFFFSYIIQEFMIIRGSWGVAKIIKYNTLLIFALLMLQALSVNCWEILFHREVLVPARKYYYDGGTLMYVDMDLALNFFLGTFIAFLGIYIYTFVLAWSGKFTAFPRPLTWITDSVAFWLKMKTPTMKIGKGRKLPSYRYPTKKIKPTEEVYDYADAEEEEEEEEES